MKHVNDAKACLADPRQGRDLVDRVQPRAGGLDGDIRFHDARGRSASSSAIAVTTQWVAGRLAIRWAYFGDLRVFRDVEGIAGGADFGEVIRHTLGSADAVVVLIGPDWLSASDDRVIGASTMPTIGFAMKCPLPSRPVCRSIRCWSKAHRCRAPKSPPASLRGLTRFNAIAISDSRWREDGRDWRRSSRSTSSATERQLHRVNLAVSISAGAGGRADRVDGGWQSVDASSSLTGQYGTPEWSLKQLFERECRRCGR